MEQRQTEHFQTTEKEQNRALHTPTPPLTALIDGPAHLLSTCVAQSQTEDGVRLIQQLKNELTAELEVNRRSCAEFQKRNQSYEMEISSLKYQLNEKDNELRTCYQHMQSLAAEKEALTLHYTNLHHQLRMCHSELCQYVEVNTKLNEQLRLKCQHMEAQYKKMTNTALSTPQQGLPATSYYCPLGGYTPSIDNKQHTISGTPPTALPEVINTVGPAYVSLQQAPRLQPTQMPTNTLSESYPPSSQCWLANDQQSLYQPSQVSCARLPQAASGAPCTSSVGYQNPTSSCSQCIVTKEQVYQRRVSQNHEAVTTCSQRVLRQATSRIENEEFPKELGSIHSLLVRPQPRDLDSAFNRQASNPGKRALPLSVTPPPSHKRSRMLTTLAFSPAGGSEVNYDSGLDVSPALGLATPSPAGFGLGTPSPALGLGTPYSLTLDTPYSTREWTLGDFHLDDTNTNNSEIDAQIDEIATSINIHPSVLDRSCTEAHLLTISKLLEHYSSYGGHLGLTDGELASISTDKTLSAPHEKPLKMLSIWHQKTAYSKKGTYRHLVRGVMEIHTNRKLVGEVCKLLK